MAVALCVGEGEPVRVRVCCCEDDRYDDALMLADTDMVGLTLDESDTETLADPERDCESL